MRTYVGKLVKTENYIYWIYGSKSATPEILEKALLPFYPQHSGRPGLGLAIADKFARFFGGRIEIESTPNEGSTVKCVLPLRKNT